MPPKQTYIIQCGEYGAVKVGSTRHKTEDRLKAIQAHCPYELRLLHLFKKISRSEKGLYYTFRHLRIRGEWFQYAGKSREFIKDPDSVNILKRPK